MHNVQFENATVMQRLLCRFLPLPSLCVCVCLRAMIRISKRRRNLPLRNAVARCAPGHLVNTDVHKRQLRRRQKSLFTFLKRNCGECNEFG